jgi:hypothetical protein
MTPITKESLVAFGFTDNTKDAEASNWFPDYMIKDLLSEEARKENPEEVFALVLTGERNVEEFAIRLPHDGGTLYLNNFESIEELDAFESKIASHSPIW